jgi:hypothetical protein
MKEFLLVFRADLKNMPKGSPEDMQARTKSWMDWIQSIAAKDKLKDRGNRLTLEGKVLKSEHVITDGPFLEIKESILGYSVIKVASWDEAVEIAKGCPIFKSNGTVEVREISVL